MALENCYWFGSLREIDGHKVIGDKVTEIDMDCNVLEN